MNVIQLDSKWYLDAVRLSEYAFQYKVPEEKLENTFRMMDKHHELYGILEGNELAAKLHFLPLEVFFAGKKVKMGGLAGVATYPEYRRKGLVKDMLTFTLEKMKKEGYSLSMLHPFKVSFYRKYGWELFSRRLKSILTSDDLVIKKRVPGSVKRYTKESHHSEIELLYDVFAERYTGMLVRDREWWEQSVYEENFTAVYYNEENQPKGYILYQIKDRKMTVSEFVPLNEEARHGLWNFICQHDSMIRELEMVTHEHEPLFHALPDPRFTAEIRPYFMARIVDAEAFLKEYEFKGTNLLLNVTDEHAPWNTGSYSIGQDGTAKTEPVQEKGISLSINSLAAILFGYQTASSLAEIGEITGDEEEIKQFEESLPGYKPFFYDFF